ncbi:O-antigen and teichoic acid export membrane protein [Paenibacillus sp. FSL R7-277]|uniref:oligosaccharide flippase family protein n=1 Tax=Paenibacillus sp. FSL R7-277 TaxID=1227352 RepID=UPI0003E2A4B4|nr:oligosaccharide flippase family protein [Paenibacillus sp. FSL R7-277]ETT72281.1 O-antigen and teichoic acid export membrane protein [Paenibacillus sp. FSL R7-277]
MNSIKNGALLSYFSLFVTLLIALLYTPIMIRLLGQSEYGLYSLIGSIAAYLSVMDMGLGNAIVRYTAKNRVDGNKLAEAKLNGLFLILYSIIGFLTLFLGVLLLKRIDNLFGSSLTSIELTKARVMIVILIINFSLSFPLSIFGSIMQAYERFIAIKLLAIIRTVITPLMTLPILFWGYGSVSVVLITTIINITSLIFTMFYSFKYLKINFRFDKIDYRLLKEIIGYSFFVFLGVIVDQIYWNTDQFILGIIAGTIPVAVYAIAMQFIRIYMQFSTSLSGMFLPRVTMMVTNKATGIELTEIMTKYGRLQFIIMGYILSGFILFGQHFINLWAGVNYGNAYYIVLIIMIPLAIPLIQNVGISILYAKNLQRFRSVILIFIAILNVAISLPLARNFGGIGAALATAISLVIGNIICMNIYYHRKIGINIKDFWLNIFLMAIPMLISIFVGFCINYLIEKNGLIFYASKILIFSGFFFTLMWFLGFNKYEKNLFLSIFNPIRSVIIKKAVNKEV